MKNKLKNKHFSFENDLNKCVYKKVEEILLILKIEIIKNNNIFQITENIYYKIYNVILNYISKNIDNYNIKEFELNLDKIIKNIINCYKKEN